MVFDIKGKTTLLRLPALSALAWLAMGLAVEPARAMEGDLVPAGGVADERPEPLTQTPDSPIPPRQGPPRIPAGGELPFEFSGYFWVDTGVMDRLNSQEGQYDQLANYMQGRMVLAATFQRPIGDYFGRARVEFLGLVNEFSKSQYEAHTLDAYAMFGSNTWDVQIGRFLPWEVYHRGQGIELYTAEETGALGAPSLYWLDQTRRYFDEAGQAAAHFYPFEWLGFEVSAVYGQQHNQNYLGVRPVAALRFGGFQALAGWEMLQQRPQTEAEKVEQTTDGYAARLQYDLPWLTVGVNYGQSTVEATRIEGDLNSEASLEKWSAGVFADIHFLADHSVGAGFHHTDQLNRQGENGFHDQTFLSYQYRLPFEGASVKAVYGFARGDIEDVDIGSRWTNDMQSFRVRVAYDLK